jgi:hypothetical protein
MREMMDAFAMELVVSSDVISGMTTPTGSYSGCRRLVALLAFGVFAEDYGVPLRVI